MTLVKDDKVDFIIGGQGDKYEDHCNMDMWGFIIKEYGKFQWQKNYQEETSEVRSLLLNCLNRTLLKQTWIPKILRVVRYQGRGIFTKGFSLKLDSTETDKEVQGKIQ